MRVRVRVRVRARARARVRANGVRVRVTGRYRVGKSTGGPRRAETPSSSTSSSESSLQP